MFEKVLNNKQPEMTWKLLVTLDVLAICGGLVTGTVGFSSGRRPPNFAFYNKFGRCQLLGVGLTFVAMLVAFCIYILYKSKEKFKTAAAWGARGTIPGIFVIGPQLMYIVGGATLSGVSTGECVGCLFAGAMISFTIFFLGSLIYQLINQKNNPPSNAGSILNCKCSPRVKINPPI